VTFGASGVIYLGLSLVVVSLRETPRGGMAYYGRKTTLFKLSDELKLIFKEITSTRERFNTRTPPTLSVARALILVAVGEEAG